MNRGQLRALTQQFLDDTLGGYFSDDIVNIWLNNAANETQKRLINAGQFHYLKCVQTQLVVGQREYVLPQDFKVLHRIELVFSGSGVEETTYVLVPMILNQKDYMPTGQGSVSGYFFKGNRIVLYPAPDSIKTIRLYYSYLLTNMSLDTDIPDVPESYHELIALYAAQDGFIKDGRASELLVKKIAEYTSRMDSDTQERNMDFVRSVNETDPSSDAGYFWY